MSVKSWISWEGGVNLIAKTGPEIATPNIIMHVARVVHTPVGSAPCGMIFWQPDPAAAPLAFGFVSSDPQVASYIAEQIFAGTPFQGAPFIQGKIDVEITADTASSTLEILGKTFKTTLTKFRDAAVISRKPVPSAPFYQQGIETIADSALLEVDGKPVEIIIPPESITGGPCTFLSATGLYAR